MRKLLYVAYFAICVLGLVSVMSIVDRANHKLLAAQEQVAYQAPAPVDPQVQIARQLEQVRAAAAQKASNEQAVRIKAAMDAEAKKINAEIAARPIPAPVIGWAPGNRVNGRVYSNSSLTVARTPSKSLADVQGPWLVVEVNPKYGVDELQRAAGDKRIHCAAFSYQPTPGVTRNRLYCSQTGK